MHLFCETAQRGAQPFFNGGVVIGHLQHFKHRHLPLDGPRQQMREVFSVRCRQFRAEKGIGNLNAQFA